MAPGIVLIIVGAIFTFALKAESSWLDVRVLGLILMLGGLAFVARSRLKRREVITRETEDADGTTQTEEKQVVERRVE
ncbi:uncharacterized membrane protein HdeD (DUF308 family) [Nocardioides thalensis]|uniref:Uncharacterized membrane protein HdeD (DUF308 family) n=1 Tax=Nocardioides thalensis TaxID=1914755 RepID=A0A853BZ07_9ACTN|nr:hypothetical protein [Nocardioides thalensis]NYJ00181.1 uncharacterized membrane protein HdeD (DUF308 family) [Nocardioides thalensis]